MIKLLNALVARIKAMFAANAALEIQADFAVRSAERKAGLLRLAAKYDEEGLTGVADDLRQQADGLHLQQTYGDVVPSINELIHEEAMPAISIASSKDAPKPAAITATAKPPSPTLHRKREELTSSNMIAPNPRRS